jgi:hypothetical protein
MPAEERCEDCGARLEPGTLKIACASQDCTPGALLIASGGRIYKHTLRWTGTGRLDLPGEAGSAERHEAWKANVVQGWMPHGQRLVDGEVQDEH